MPNSYVREKICEHCKILFTKRMTNETRFCSRQCAKLATKKNSEAKCIQCQVQLIGNRLKKRKFCSINCSSKHRMLARSPICPGCGIEMDLSRSSQKQFCTSTCAYKNRVRKKNGSDVPCLNCGALVYRCVTRQKTNTFCSIDCHNVYQSRNKVVYGCTICHEKYNVSPVQARERNRKYCSLQCRDNDPDRLIHLRELMRLQGLVKINKFEQRCYDFLSENHIVFQKQVLIAKKFCVDALLTNYPIIVQLDGDYWHGNPEKYSDPDARQRRRMGHDISQDAYFKKMGYVVVRVWESEMKSDPTILLTKLDHAIQNLK